MRVEFHVPDEVRAAVEPHIERWRSKAPPWLYLLYVMLGTDEDGTPLDMTTRSEYRTATLRVYRAYLEEREESRSELVLHELIEAHLGGLRDLAQRLLESSPLYDDDASRTLAEEELRRAGEGAVSDLVAVISRSLTTAVP